VGFSEKIEKSGLGGPGSPFFEKKRAYRAGFGDLFFLIIYLTNWRQAHRVCSVCLFEQAIFQTGN
jgi:hypothetical protein